MSTNTHTYASPVRRKGAALPDGAIRSARVGFTRAVLMLADVVGLAAGAFAGSFAWMILQPLADPQPFLALWPLLILVPVAFWFLGLYPAAGISPVDELRRITVSLALLYVSTALAMVMLTGLESASRGILVFIGLATILLVPLARALARQFFASRDWWGVPAVVFGGGKTASLLLERLQAHPGLAVKPVAILDDDPQKQNRSVCGIPVLGGLARAAQLQREYGVQYAIIAMPGVSSARTAEIIDRFAHPFRYTVIVPNFFDTTSIGTTTRDFAGVVGLHYQRNLLLPRNRILKRVVDLLLLVPVGVVALPVLMLAALAVVLVSPGNPFYGQRREGYRGRTIKVWKLRTMRTDADETLKEHLRTNPDAKREWETHFKLTHDPRILPVVGGILRKASLDELPQLFNILMAEMSFVGPRPFPYYHVEQFDPPFRELRSSVLPGLTGYWQTTSRSTADQAAQERLDSYYIRNWSIWMDLYLLACTPRAVLAGKGAY